MGALEASGDLKPGQVASRARSLGGHGGSGASGDHGRSGASGGHGGSGASGGHGGSGASGGHGGSGIWPPPPKSF